MTRAMHYHLSVELPQGYHFSPSTDVDQNGYFQTQLYFKDDPYAAEDQARFGPSSGFAPSRVIPDDGVVNVKVRWHKRLRTHERSHVDQSTLARRSYTLLSTSILN